MRVAEVYRNRQLAGTLTEYSRDSYIFRYDDVWFASNELPAISLTLPKTQQEYRANHLFPYFFNMLSEGVNKKLQCRQLKIDKNDNFGLLMAVANIDTVGAITVRAVKEEE